MPDWDNEFEGGMIDSPEQKTEEINRKITPVFFLIDVSGSMRGKKIDIVNNSMEQIMRDLAEMDSADFDLRFAVLSFETNCVWETGDELQPCDGEWNPLETGSLTYFNTACRDLKDKLSGKHGFFRFATGKTITPPVIILLTDGYANDGDVDGKDGIAELKQNKYFKGSYKLAIAIGDEANQNLCVNFTGDDELVFTAYNEKALSGLLNAVIKGSIVVSSSGSSNPGLDNNGEAKKPDKFEPDKDILKQTLNAEMKSNPDLEESVNIASNEDWD